MKISRLLLILVLAAGVAGSSCQTAEANGLAWPDCGTKTITTHSE